MNTPTPTNPPAATPPVTPATPAKDTMRDALFNSLKLTVMEADPAPNPNAPQYDSGVETPSTITDFSDRSGSIADVLQSIEKTAASTPAAAPQTPATPPTATPPVAASPTTPPTPSVAPTTPPAAEPPLRKIEIPALPKPATEEFQLPPPPSNLDLTGLDDDEQNEVQNAIFAEQRYPEKYKGLGAKVLSFIKEHKQFVKTQEAENPDVSFDTDNQTYQRFLQQNRPNLSVSERKKLERERLLEEAASLAERRVASKSKKLEDEIVKLKAEPLVNKTVKDFESMVKDLMPKDDDPLVEETAKHVSGKAVNAGREFLLLANNLNPYDSRNETHRWLGEFIQEQGELYQKSGHASLKRGTRTFVPRAKFNSLPAEERNKHFTFTDEDVLQLLAMNAKAATEYHVNTERDRLKKAGYTRSVAPSAPVAPPPVEPSGSPRASVSVAPATPNVPDTRSTADPFMRFMAGK